MTLTVAALAVLLSRSMAEAAPAAGLVSAVVRLPVGEVPVAVASVAKGVIQTMTLIRLKFVAAVVLSLGLLGLAGGLLSRTAVQAQGPAPVGAQFPVLADKKPVAAKNKIEVPSQRNGILIVVGTDIKPGDKVPPGQVIKVRIAGEEKQFRRLRVGDRVEEGQLLARLDDRLARDELAIADARIKAKEADLRATEKTVEEARVRLARILKMAAGNLISEEEVRGARLTAARYTEEVASKKEELKIAVLQRKSAATIVQMHEIRSPVTGVVRKIHKQRGEAVKALEPVFQIEIEEDK